MVVYRMMKLDKLLLGMLLLLFAVPMSAQQTDAKNILERTAEADRKSTRLNSSHASKSRMPSSA